MEESGCTEDEINAATNELEDSDEQDTFYDWLMARCKEAIVANKKLAPYFFRFTELETLGN